MSPLEPQQPQYLLRKRFRNLHITQILQYRLPLAGVVSILHRISGLFLFLMLPIFLYGWQQTLTSENTFESFKNLAAGICPKLFFLSLSWAYLHHFCAGIRHLFMDQHIGLSKNASRQSAMAVFIVSGCLTAMVALKLFGVL